MTIDEFWEHIRATQRADSGEHSERLAKRLAKLPIAEILDFERLWDEASGKAYVLDLWGAAYLINGGCSDDGFHYFRCWLVLQGRAVYEAALANPDTLAGVVNGEEYAEAGGGPGMDAWFLATKTQTDEAGYDAYGLALTSHQLNSKTQAELARGASELVLVGEDWDFDDDDEVRKRLPRLAKKYLDSD